MMLKAYITFISPRQFGADVNTLLFHHIASFLSDGDKLQVPLGFIYLAPNQVAGCQSFMWFIVCTVTKPQKSQ